MPVVYTKAYYVHSNDCSSALDVCLCICPYSSVFVSVSLHLFLCLCVCPCVSAFASVPLSLCFCVTDLVSIVSRPSVSFCLGLFICIIDSSQSVVSY